MTTPKAEGVLMEGENLEVDPPRRLCEAPLRCGAKARDGKAATRITWEIEPVGDSCRLTVTHDQLPEGANPQPYGGWPMTLSGLKTWLETGQVLTTSGSLMYA